MTPAKWIESAQAVVLLPENGAAWTPEDMARVLAVLNVDAYAALASAIAAAPAADEQDGAA